MGGREDYYENREIVLAYFPTLEKKIAKREKHYKVKFDTEVYELLERLLLGQINGEDIISQYEAYKFNESLDEFVKQKKLHKPNGIKLQNPNSERAIKKVISTNTRILIDHMYEFHMLGQKYASNYKNPDEIIKTASLVSALSWICPIWPFC